ncbi:hypothetical protein C8Q73DRAFT_189874 [Cubamyces lactineus]|nr:hypothetical protein C8Q73DRAFT_189874 [Cubamyces lactineus]
MKCSRESLRLASSDDRMSASRAGLAISLPNGGRTILLGFHSALHISVMDPSSETRVSLSDSQDSRVARAVWLAAVNLSFARSAGRIPSLCRPLSPVTDECTVEPIRDDGGMSWCITGRALSWVNDPEEVPYGLGVAARLETKSTLGSVWVTSHSIGASQGDPGFMYDGTRDDKVLAPLSSLGVRLCFLPTLLRPRRRTQRNEVTRRARKSTPPPTAEAIAGMGRRGLC